MSSLVLSHTLRVSPVAHISQERKAIAPCSIVQEVPIVMEAHCKQTLHSASQAHISPCLARVNASLVRLDTYVMSSV